MTQPTPGLHDEAIAEPKRAINMKWIKLTATKHPDWDQPVFLCANGQYPVYAHGVLKSIDQGKIFTFETGRDDKGEPLTADGFSHYSVPTQPVE